MPKDPRIKKVLVIGSGPIIIGQAAEFDYSGTQACRALKAEGIETVLLNSNPATIMTDPDVADHVYIEPMTLEVVERILDIEKPDSVLPNLGGQMGLNLSMELARSGYLDRTGIRLLASPSSPLRWWKRCRTLWPVQTALATRSSCVRPLPWAAPAAASARTRQSSSRSAPTACAFPPSIRSLWKSALPAGKRSSTRSCATTRAM